MKRFLLFLPTLSYYLGGERVVGKTIIGKDRWLYTSLDDAIPKHMGELCLMPEETTNWVRIALTSKEATEQFGGKFLVVIAPDKQSIYPEFLPSWLAHNPGKCDRYQQVIEALQSAGIATVDARSVLLREKQDGRVFFKNDTHWNDVGSYATYLAVRNVFGWKSASPTMIARVETKVGGDMIQALNVSHVKESTVTYVGYVPPNYDNPEPLKSIYSKPNDHFRSHMLNGVGDKGRVLIVGDSYSWMMRKYFLQDAREVAWTDRRWGHESDAIRTLHPDWVVMEVVERAL